MGTLEYAFLGFFIALAIGLTGVGAGTLTAPTLILLGLDPAKAVGSALMFSSVVKFPALLFHILYRNVDWRVFWLMSAGGIPGVLMGSYILSKLSRSEPLKNVILVIVGLTIILSITINTLLLLKGKRLNLTKYSFLLPVFCFLIGLEVGFTSAGAGALGMVLLLYFTPLEPSKAVGVDVAFGLTCSLVGASFNFLRGNMDPNLLIPMSLGGLVGVWLGVYLTRVIRPEPLKVIISLLLIVVALNLIKRGIGS